MTSGFPPKRPPNYMDLPDELKTKIDEDIYRAQSQIDHSYYMGDPRLKTSKMINKCYNGKKGE